MSDRSIGSEFRASGAPPRSKLTAAARARVITSSLLLRGLVSGLMVSMSSPGARATAFDLSIPR